MHKILIVNADDLGLSPGVNRGIIQSHVTGIVTSTSLMVCGEFASHGVDLVLKEAVNLELGLHITLTGEGKPITKGQTLVTSDGGFPGYDDWLKNYQLFDNDEIEDEITAQWEEFIRLVGQLPRHVDSHHYICFKHPAALRALIRLTGTNKVPVRYREDVDELRDIPFDSRQEMQKMLTMSQLTYPHNCIKSFYKEDATVVNLHKIISSLPDHSISELLCHPGIVDLELRSRYKQFREVELRVLTDHQIRQSIIDNKIQLSNYCDAFQHC